MNEAGLSINSSVYGDLGNDEIRGSTRSDHLDGGLGNHALWI
jgi:hypothetical protein